MVRVRGCAGEQRREGTRPSVTWRLPVQSERHWLAGGGLEHLEHALGRRSAHVVRVELDDVVARADVNARQFLPVLLQWPN